MHKITIKSLGPHAFAIIKAYSEAEAEDKAIYLIGNILGTSICRR